METNLKKSPVAESEPDLSIASRSVLGPRVVRGKPLLIAGLRRRYEVETLEGIPEQWKRFAAHVGRIPRQTASGVAYGVCWEAADGDGVEYLSGVEVNGFAGLRSEFTVVSIPALRYAVFEHHEHVSTLRETVDGILAKWLPASGLEVPSGVAETPAFLERYTEEFDPESGLGGVQVWVPVRA